MSLAEEIKKELETINSSWHEYKRANDKRLEDLDDATKTVTKSVSEWKEHLEKVDKELEDAVEAKTKLEAKVEKIQTTLNRVGELQQDTTKTRGLILTPEQKEYRELYDTFLRKGGQDVEHKLSELEAKALSVGSDPSGGYAVEPVIQAGLDEYIVETSPVRSVATTITIGTDSWVKLMESTKLPSGGWVAETAARAETGTGTFRKITIPVYEQYANPASSQQALDDMSFSAEDWLISGIGDVFARTENTAFVTGDGSGKPTGFLSYTAGTDHASDQIEQINLGEASDISTSASSDGLMELQDALFEDFQTNAVWGMQRATKTKIRQLKATGTGEYLLVPGLTQGAADQLLGRPVALMADMPAVAANALAVVYGDFRRGYTIVDRTGTRILRDPYTNKPFVNFYATKRTGGGVTQFQAIKIGKVAV